MTPEPGPAPRLVVAAIIEERGRVLVAQRSEERHYPLRWEFPGGKIEPGERPEAALERELHEELGVRVDVGPLLDRRRHDYGDGHDYEISFHACTIREGRPTVQPAQGLRRIDWIARARLPELDLLEGNRAIARRLAGQA